MTTVASAVFNVQGFEDRYTRYVIEARNPTVDLDKETVSVEVWGGDRRGDSAFVEQADYTLLANGREIATANGANFSGRSSSMGRSVTLSGQIDASQQSISMEVVTTLPAWDDATETMTFSVDIPQPPASDDLSVSCSVAPQQVAPGDPVTVAGTVENTASSAASVKVTIAAGDASRTEQLEIPAGKSGTVEVEFELPVGTYTPTVSASVV